MRKFSVLLVVAALGCGRAQRRVGLPAPSPNGCYVIVYEQPGFHGVGDVLNGPARWPTLEHLRQTNEESWHNRIRSLRTGSGATVTVYTDRRFTGESRQFGPDAEHQRLDQAFAGRIESLELTCPKP